MNNNQDKPYNLEEIQPITYASFVALKNFSSNRFLMICELIDNAISSMEREFGNLQGWKFPLMVEINNHTDIRGETKSLAKRYPNLGQSIDYTENSFLEVVDNGFGMNENDLKEAVKLNNVNRVFNNNSSRMNVHGRGLNQSAFYFGSNLRIFSKTKTNDLHTIALLAAQNKFDDVILFRPQKATNEEITKYVSDEFSTYNHGTIVRIENVYRNKIIDNKRWHTILLPGLQSRYRRYFKEKKLIIKYHDYKNPITEIDHSISDADKKISFVTILSEEKVEEIISDVSKTLKNILPSDKDRNKSEFDEVVLKMGSEANSKIQDLYRQAASTSVDNGSEVHFKFALDVPFSVNKDDLHPKIMKIDFWKLESRQAKWSGFEVYDGERPIYHGPKYQSIIGGYTDWFSQRIKNKTSGTTEDVFAGRFNIADIDGQPTHDKSKFQLANEDWKAFLDDVLFVVWKVFQAWEQRERKVPNNDKGFDLTSKTDLNVLINLVKNNFKDESIKILTDENELENDQAIVYETPIEDSEGVSQSWKVKIFIDSEKISPLLYELKDFFLQKREIHLITYTRNVFFNGLKDIIKKNISGESIVGHIVFPLTHFIAKLVMHEKLKNYVYMIGSSEEEVSSTSVLKKHDLARNADDIMTGINIGPKDLNND